jgi:hypothetical protein
MVSEHHLFVKMALTFAGTDQLIATKTRLEFHRQRYGQYGM